MSKIRRIDKLIQSYIEFQRPRLAAGTLEGYRLRLGRVARAMGLLNVGDVKEEVVERYVRGRLAGGRMASTINGEVRLLALMLGWAAAPRRRLIAGNVLREWRPLREAVVSGRRTLSADERRALVSGHRHAVGRGERRRGCLYGVIWRTLLCTGMRPSELVRLRRHDLDCDDGGVWVPGSKSRLAARRVPFMDGIGEVLDDVAPASGLVFPVLGGTADPVRNLWKRFRRCAAAAGLGDGVRPYTLRHTFATEAARRGIPARVLQSWMGHARVETTLRYYVHVIDAQQVEAAGLMRGIASGR